MKNTMPIAELFKKHGIKATPQRMAIYNMLLTTKQHPNVEMIYKALEKDYPTMSLATVYKTVDMLKKAGLIQELTDIAFTSRYDANTAPHPHIICLSCNRVDDIDVDLPINYNLIESIDKITGFSTQSYQLYFYGYCPDCLKTS